MQNKRALIIVPACNEAANIADLIKEIQGNYPDFPILVINDGSSDRTAKEAEQAGALVVSHPYNLGIGGAVQTGYKVAAMEEFDAVVQMDGDGQHDPSFLMDVLNPVLHDELDLSIGSRFLSPNAEFRSTFIRRIGIRFFAFLLGALTGIQVTDPTSGYRATGRKLIRRFADFYPVDFPEPEAIKIAKRFNAKVGEVPVNMRKRVGGKSSIRYLKTFYYMIKVTLAIVIDALKKKDRG